MVLWVFGLVFLVSITLINASTLRLYTLDSSKYPTAVCVDGSQAGYYFNPSSSGPSAPWLIYLQWGGWCYDLNSCTERCGPPDKIDSSNSLCSSEEWGSTIQLEGVFQPDSANIFSTLQTGNIIGVNQVFVRYCSSDAHMGSADAFGYRFHGHDIVQSVLTELVHSHSLAHPDNNYKADDQPLVIFGGGSAGARGAMIHLDYVQGMISRALASMPPRQKPNVASEEEKEEGEIVSNPEIKPNKIYASIQKAGASVKVIGFLDSPLWIDVKPYTSRFPGFGYITAKVHGYAQIQHLGQECSELYSASEQWKCMFGQYRMPTVRTPYLLVASQYDSYQVGKNVGREPETQSEKAYAMEFANKTASLVHFLHTQTRNDVSSTTNSNNNHAVYSWACFNHCTSPTDSGFNSKTCQHATNNASSSATMNQATELFLQHINGGETSIDLAWVDSCQGFNCGRGCSSSFQQFE